MKLLYGLTKEQMEEVRREVEMGEFEKSLREEIEIEEGLYDGNDEVVVTDKLIRSICEYSLDFDKDTDVFTILKNFFKDTEEELEYKDKMELLYGLNKDQMFEVARVVNIERCKDIIKDVSEDREEIEYTKEQLQDMAESLASFRDDYEFSDILEFIHKFLNIDTDGD